MRQFANSKQMKGANENRLEPISVSGVLIPQKSEYKLLCHSGMEYDIVSNSEVRDTLPLYSWKEVKIIGLLNKANSTLIPQKVLPKGTDGELSNVIDLASRRKVNMRKVLNRINELVVIPAAVLAVLVS